MTNPNLPAFIRRDVERAIEDALHPAGMSTHDGKARIGVDRLQYLMRMVDGLPVEPANGKVLEFLRSFIAGGVNQDFKPWASELYQKLYRAADEPECDRALDRAYYNGARQAAAMGHQSLEAMDEWINAGCGGRGPVANRPAEPV